MMGGRTAREPQNNGYGGAPAFARSRPWGSRLVALGLVAVITVDASAPAAAKGRSGGSHHHAANKSAASEADSSESSRSQFQSDTGQTGAAAPAASPAPAAAPSAPASSATPTGSSDNGRQSTPDTPGANTTAPPTSKADTSRAPGDRKSSSTAAEPPATVAEWLQGIFKPAPATTQATAPAPPPPGHPPVAAPASGALPVPAAVPAVANRAAVPNERATPAPVAAPAKAPSRSTGGIARHNTPPLPDGRPELLAANLTASGLGRAVAAGFAPNGTTSVASLNLVLTRLLAPAGMLPDDARDALRASVPETDVDYNLKYRIYRPQAGVEPAAHIAIPPPAASMNTPCGNDRYFAASVINWSAKLQDCTRTTRIGVIDTGFDANHPAFKSRAITSFRPSAETRPKSPDWHGTGVLALLAGDARSATPGLLPNAKFYVADIFYADSDGAPASDTANLIAALDWLERHNVKVVNLSLAGPPDDLLERTIEGLAHKDVIFVAAVGNDGPAAPPSYPAAYKSVLAVTAVDKNLIGYRHATHGNHVDVAAPGVDIWTAMPQGGEGYHSGTSFAVPFVTAVLATVYKDLPEKSKGTFLRQAQIQDLGDLGRDPIYGLGLLMAPTSCDGEPRPPASTPPGANGGASVEQVSLRR